MDNKDYIEVEPLQQFILEDKSKYKRASEVINHNTGRHYIDPDNDFLVGASGGFLMNIDFTFVDTHLIKSIGNTFDKFKRFTFDEADTIEYDKFHDREVYRRKSGYTAKCKKLKNGEVVDLHITGEHYNFINYGYIEKLDRASLLIFGQEPDKHWGIPENFDSQYWIFKIKQFAIVNGYNNIILKSRRKGMSFIEGVDSANFVNLKPGGVAIHAAYESKYLTKAGALSIMAKKQLNFYEEHTPFIRGAIDDDGKSKGLFKKVNDELILGYVDANGNPGGYQSIIFTVSTKNSADVAVGKSAKKVKCDELNTFPNFTEFLKMTNPTTTTGAFKTGNITAFGTGGTKEGNWAEFERHYYNTATYDFMPFENVWDENSRDEVTGLFLPYWWGLEGVNKDGKWSIDEDGNTDYEIAIEISRLERSNKLKVVGLGSDYISYCSQYANRPGEAFNSGTTKVLSSLELKNHIKNVKSKKEYRNYTDGWLFNEKDGVRFKTNDDLLSSKIEYHPYVTDVPFKDSTDVHGCLRIHNYPFRTREGIIPDNLFFVTYDQYAANIEDNEITTKHSLACAQVWMYPNNISYSAGKILVAAWVGRLHSTELADEFVLMLGRFYNAKILPEVDRGTFVATAKKHRQLSRILPDPADILSKPEESRKKTLGMVIGKGDRKAEGIVMVKDLIYERISVNENDQFIHRFELINDLPTLLEFDGFSYKGNFDRVSATILAAYQINAYLIKNIKASSHREQQRLYDIIKKNK